MAAAFAPASSSPRDLALQLLDDATLLTLATYLDAAAVGYDTDGEARGRVREASRRGGGRPRRPVRRSGARSPPRRAGRLVFVTAAPTVTIEGAADLGAELYRARFKGAIPSARVRDGMITIRLPALRLVRLAGPGRRRVGERLGALAARPAPTCCSTRRCRGPSSCVAARRSCAPTSGR